MIFNVYHTPKNAHGLLQRRKIRLIEGNAKCRYLKFFTCTGTLWQVFYLSVSAPLLGFGVEKQFCRFGIWSNIQCITPVEALQPARSPPPSCYTLYKYSTWTPVLIHTGKGGGELTREKARGATVHKGSPVENTNMTDCIANLYKLY